MSHTHIEVDEAVTAQFRKTYQDQLKSLQTLPRLYRIKAKKAKPIS